MLIVKVITVPASTLEDTTEVIVIILVYVLYTQASDESMFRVPVHVRPDVLIT